MQEIPEKVYYLFGFLILTNLGTIASVVVFGFKATWWLSKLDSRVTHSQETGNRAHKRIDKYVEGNV